MSEAKANYSQQSLRLGADHTGQAMKLIATSMLLLATNGEAKRGARIVGGHDANPNDFRYQVGIADPQGNQFCGGSLYNDTCEVSGAEPSPRRPAAPRPLPAANRTIWSCSPSKNLPPGLG